jgi:DNA-binding IclR family transcriptional regulator
MDDISDRQEEERYIVPAAEQASRILFCLAATTASTMGLIEISTQLGINKSKVFSLLKTLQKYGLVQKNREGKGYGLGPGLIALSRRFLDNLSAPRLAQPILDDLARKTGSTAALGLIAEKNVFVAAKREGGSVMGITMRVGHRFPISYGCHGKAIAAFLPREEFDRLFREKRLYFQGDPARYDKQKTLKDIERCRLDWYAVDAEETAPGLNAVSAPVLGPNRYPIGYLVVLGLLSGEAAYQHGPLVAAAGKDLSRQLGADID